LIRTIIQTEQLIGFSTMRMIQRATTKWLMSTRKINSKIIDQDSINLTVLLLIWGQVYIVVITFVISGKMESGFIITMLK